MTLKCFGCNKKLVKTDGYVYEWEYMIKDERMAFYCHWDCYCQKTKRNLKGYSRKPITKVLESSQLANNFIKNLYSRWDPIEKARRWVHCGRLYVEEYK